MPETPDTAAFSATTLSNEAWRAILDAARRTPDNDSEARAALTTIPDEYAVLKYDRARVAEPLKRSQKMLKQLDAFAKLYLPGWVPQLPVEHLHASLRRCNRRWHRAGPRPALPRSWSCAARSAPCAYHRFFLCRAEQLRELEDHLDASEDEVGSAEADDAEVLDRD